jgi:hypothetical protein
MKQFRTLPVPVGPVNITVLAMLRYELRYVFNAGMRFGKEIPAPQNSQNPALGQYSAEAITGQLSFHRNRKNTTVPLQLSIAMSIPRI